MTNLITKSQVISACAGQLLLLAMASVSNAATYDVFKFNLADAPTNVTLGSYSISGRSSESPVARITRSSGSTNFGFSFEDLTDLDPRSIALSPFGNSLSNSAFTLNFDRPVSSFSVRAGDFGADSPDRVTVTAYNSEGRIVDTDRVSIPTDTDDFQEYNSRSMTVSSSFTDIATVLMLGGTTDFPHSVYYDRMSVGVESGLTRSIAIAKGTGLLETWSDAVEYSPVAGLGLTFAGTPCADASSCGVKAAGFLAIAGYSYLTLDGVAEIINDPPRFDYDNLSNLDFEATSPESLELTAFGSNADAVARGIEALVLQDDLLEAWLETLERHAGAELDGDTEAAGLQEAHLDRILELVSRNAAELSSLSNLAAQSALFEANALPTSDEFLEARSRIAADGLEPVLRNILQEIGFSLQQIERIEQDFASLELGDLVAPRDVLFEASQFQSDLSNVASCTLTGCLVDRIEIDTPLAAFFLDVQARFDDPNAIMDIYIGNRFVGALEAAGLFETSTSFFVDDPLLFGLDEALLTSYLRGSNQGTAYLSDYRVSSAPVAPVPLPASAYLLAFGLGALGCFRRLNQSARTIRRSA